MKIDPTALTDSAIDIGGWVATVVFGALVYRYHGTPVLRDILAVVAVGAYAISIFWRNRRSRVRVKSAAEVEQMEQQLEALSENLEGFLQTVIKTAALTDLRFDEKDRISVYRHAGKNFVRIARFSTNPFLARGGRDRFSEEDGVIGQAWRSGKVYLTGLPAVDQNFQSYLDHLQEKHVKLETETHRGLRMKSQSYFGFRVDNAHQNLAVVIIERESPRFHTSHGQSWFENWSQNSAVAKLIAEALIVSTAPGLDPQKGKGDEPA